MGCSPDKWQPRSAPLHSPGWSAGCCSDTAPYLARGPSVSWLLDQVCLGLLLTLEKQQLLGSSASMVQALWEYAQPPEPQECPQFGVISVTARGAHLCLRCPHGRLSSTLSQWSLVGMSGRRSSEVAGTPVDSSESDLSLLLGAGHSKANMHSRWPSFLRKCLPSSPTHLQ